MQIPWVGEGDNPEQRQTVPLRAKCAEMLETCLSQFRLL